MNDWTTTEVVGKQLYIQCSTHQDQFEISETWQGFSQSNEKEITEPIPFMDFILQQNFRKLSTISIVDLRVVQCNQGLGNTINC